MKKDAGITLITGSRGSGKTTRQKELIKTKRRVIVLDPMDNFGGSGFRRCTSIQAVAAEIKRGWNNGFKIIIPTGHREDQCLSFMRQLVPALFMVQRPYFDANRNMAGREICVVVDEAHKFFPNRKFSPGEGEAAEDLISLGRHYGIEIIAASQRLAKVWTEFRGNCTEMYFFSQGDHTDISAALSIIGNANKAALMDLKPHQYLHKSRAAGSKITRGVNKFAQ